MKDTKNTSVLLLIGYDHSYRLNSKTMPLFSFEGNLSSLFYFLYSSMKSPSKNLIWDRLLLVDYGVTCRTSISGIVDSDNSGKVLWRAK